MRAAHGGVSSSTGTAAVTENDDDVPRMMPGASADTVTATMPGLSVTPTVTSLRVVSAARIALAED